MKKELRFDLKAIPVSSIAEQWYCEKAVDLYYRHPSIQLSSPALAAGSLEHGYFASGAELLSRQEIIEGIKSGRALSLREVPFGATYRGTAIKGIPDYVDIKKGKALSLKDYKFSSYRRVFPSHRFQVDLYGYLLNKNGLNTDKLKCAIAILSPRLSREMVSPDEIIYVIKAGQAEMRRKRYSSMYLNAPGIYGELYSFSLDKAEQHLSWAIDYWTKRRRPKSTTKPKKCEACAFNAAGVCNEALAGPSN